MKRRGREEARCVACMGGGVLVVRRSSAEAIWAEQVFCEVSILMLPRAGGI